MKAKNLQILKEEGINVPNFIVAEREDDVDLSFSNAPSFAVRSSFCLEDNDEKSFAGQLKTVLSVKREDVKRAFSEVRKSYDKTLYKNIKGGHVLSPVIIQEMIAADLSGIIFTANPLGILSEAVITAGCGTGENIVADQTETVTYYYNKDEALFYIKELSGFSLDYKILNELIDVAFKIRDIFAKETDIEFAIKDDIVYILQARPITTLKIDNLLILDNSNIVESYPGISLPLTHDFVHNVYRDIFRSCISRFIKSADLLEGLESVLDHMVAGYQGSIYYVITSWYQLLQLLPFSKQIIKIWQEMLGVDNKLVVQSNLRIGKWLKLKMSVSFLCSLIITPYSMKKLNQYFDNTYPEYREKIKHANTMEELLALFHEIEKSITDVWDITLINDMYTFIFTALSGGKKNEKIANIKNLESMKPALAINELRQAAKEYGVSSALYQEKEKEYIESFGDRISGELKLETKTYRTHPELFRQQILSMENTTVSMDVSGKSLNPFVCAAKSGIANREKSRMNRSRLFGLAREIVLKTGALFVKNGQLDQKEDIFYLYLNEMNPSAKYQKLVQKRKEQFRLYESAPHPRRIVFSNGLIEDRRIVYEKQFDGIGMLTGTRTSLGKVTGEAIVIHDVSKNPDVQDKIIITRSTDPGWIFLLENCKGIIAEQGSILSHTAIISRELKKPAIVNVKDATKVIKTGDWIELDADSGTVNILKRRD